MFCHQPFLLLPHIPEVFNHGYASESPAKPFKMQPSTCYARSSESELQGNGVQAPKLFRNSTDDCDILVVFFTSMPSQAFLLSVFHLDPLDPRAYLLDMSTQDVQTHWCVQESLPASIPFPSHPICSTSSPFSPPPYFSLNEWHQLLLNCTNQKLDNHFELFYSSLMSNQLSSHISFTSSILQSFYIHGYYFRLS